MESAALAGSVASSSARMEIRNAVVFIETSIPVRAVRAQAQDVLDEEFVVGRAGNRFAARELQAEAGELGRVVVDHDACALGTEGAGLQQPVGRAEVDASRVEPVVAHARTPLGMPLVDALHV